MLPTENPLFHLNTFFSGLKNGFHDKDDFLSKYYRALLVDSNVRLLKRYYQAGDAAKVAQKINEILSLQDNKTKEEIDREFNLTLHNIIKFHLDEYIGKENTDQNLESLQKYMNWLVDLIFLKQAPFSVHVTDTTAKRDKSKEIGSHFQVKIVPHTLSF